MKLRARRRFAWNNERGTVERGEIIDTDDFPDIPEHKWNQLRNPGSGHFLEDVDPPGRAPRDESVLRGASELARAANFSIVERFKEQQDEHGVWHPVETFEAREPDAVPVLDVACGTCGFVAKTPHGLLVHRGRKH